MTAHLPHTSIPMQHYESMQLTDDLKRRIETEARNAASQGTTLHDSCPYPYKTEEGRHFIAIFLLAGGKNEQPGATA